MWPKVLCEKGLLNTLQLEGHFQGSSKLHHPQTPKPTIPSTSEWQRRIYKVIETFDRFLCSSWQVSTTGIIIEIGQSFPFKGQESQKLKTSAVFLILAVDFSHQLLTNRLQRREGVTVLVILMAWVLRGVAVPQVALPFHIFSLKTTEFGPYSVILYDNYYNLISVPCCFILQLWQFLFFKISLIFLPNLCFTVNFEYLIYDDYL